ncbi:Zinc finger, RING-CH-type [Dillenia turbinata]|uniref:Zinc finger, RING-CH-type n=1 Tax=Dillenia turbinata TaxID=194707 RepID=A0AAN8W4H3_9MAGN
MSALDMCEVHIEEGHRRSSDGSGDGSLCFSDSDEGSSYSQFYSTFGGSYDEYRFACVSDPEIGGVSDSRRISSASDCSIEVVNDGEITEIKVHLAKVEKDCRICHLSLDSVNHEAGIPIELGCSCKDDLAAAHRQCAEAWFKIKGNKFQGLKMLEDCFCGSLTFADEYFWTCEICNTTARNILGPTEVELIEVPNEANTAAATSAVSMALPTTETRSFWHGHRILNFLLACMVFAFVISWLFHFNVPS